VTAIASTLAGSPPTAPAGTAVNRPAGRPTRTHDPRLRSRTWTADAHPQRPRRRRRAEPPTIRRWISSGTPCVASPGECSINDSFKCLRPVVGIPHRELVLDPKPDGAPRQRPRRFGRLRASRAWPSVRPTDGGSSRRERRARSGGRPHVSTRHSASTAIANTATSRSPWTRMPNGAKTNGRTELFPPKTKPESTPLSEKKWSSRELSQTPRGTTGGYRECPRHPQAAAPPNPRRSLGRRPIRRWPWRASHAWRVQHRVRRPPERRARRRLRRRLSRPR
jgi:hypothetical protein